MSVSAQPPFSYLQSKIREWKAGDLLMPQTQGWERFQKVAPVQLSQICLELQQALKTEGIRATLHEMSEDKRHLSLTIEQFDIEIAFRPDPNPHALLLYPRAAEPTPRMSVRGSSPTKILSLTSGMLWKSSKMSPSGSWGPDEPAKS